MLDSYEDRTLYTTWQITFDRIQQQNGASAKLLKLWAYFNRQDLWFDLLRHANSTDDEWIEKLTEDELKFNEAITLLCNFGLVDLDRPPQQQVGSRVYSIHSCVHSWTVSVLNEEWDESLARLALTCVALEVPNTDEKQWWLLQRRLLQHVSRQAVFIMDGKVDINRLYWALHSLGGLYADQGKLAEAEAMYIRALQGYEDALGPELTSSYLPALNTMIAFGDLFSQTDRKEIAKVMYNRALSGYTAVQGPSSKWCKQLEDRLQTL
jgi:tetratricopeptide (TPR) repeat protein